MAQNTNVLSFIACALISIISLVSGTAIQEQPSDNVTIDFKALLDKSLYDVPVAWLVSQGIMADQAVDRGFNLTLALPNCDDANCKWRKNHGVPAAALISSLLVPNTTISRPSAASSLCQALVTKKTDSFSELEEAGSFRWKTLVSPNRHSTELSKALCSRLVPGIETRWTRARPVVRSLMYLNLSCGFREILYTHMTDLGLNEHQAMRFADLFEEASCRVENFDYLDRAFDVWIRKIEYGTANMATAASDYSLPEPAIKNLLQFADTTLKYFNPPEVRPEPFVPASTSIGMLGQFLRHFKRSMERAVEFDKDHVDRGQRTHILTFNSERAESAEKYLEQGLKDQAIEQLKLVADSIRSVHDWSTPIFPPNMDCKLASYEICSMLSRTPFAPIPNRIEHLPVRALSVEKLPQPATVAPYPQQHSTQSVAPRPRYLPTDKKCWLVPHETVVYSSHRIATPTVQTEHTEELLDLAAVTPHPQQRSARNLEARQRSTATIHITRYYPVTTTVVKKAVETVTRIINQCEKQRN